MDASRPSSKFWTIIEEDGTWIYGYDGYPIESKSEDRPSSRELISMAHRARAFLGLEPLFLAQVEIIEHYREPLSVEE